MAEELVVGLGVGAIRKTTSVDGNGDRSSGTSGEMRYFCLHNLIQDSSVQ